MTSPHFSGHTESPPPADNTTPAEVSAATITSARERFAQGPDGDTVFILACQLGLYGPALQQKYHEAAGDVGQDGPTYTPAAATRIAGRIITLVNDDPGSTPSAQAPTDGRPAR